jgi:Asp-tRNA(Asn)/Glu-tRNA(Gln) amidotransferase A subunit family amidase
MSVLPVCGALVQHDCEVALSLGLYGAAMIAQLVERVKSGDVSAADVVAEALNRIDRDDGALNAVVALRRDEAIAEARQHDGHGRLAGLPLLVKDMARVAGMRTTMGSPLFADADVDQIDDVVVARLKAQGAIVVGRTNSPEFGHTAVTTNPLHGTTVNPWNHTRSPGGSSGGSTAALSAGLVPLATTSDGGGSTRGPASSCGLVGYKPSMGAIGRNITPRWMTFSTLGVAASTVADTLLQAEIILGAAHGDINALPTGSVSLTPQMPTRVVAVRTFRADVDEVIESAFNDACDQIEHELAIEVERRPSLFSTDSMMAWFCIATAELAQSLLEFQDRWSECSDSLAFQLKWGRSVTLDDYLAAQRLRYVQAAELDDVLTPATVVIVPTSNCESWLPEGPLPSSAGSTVAAGITLNTTDLNMTGHCGISVPLGLDRVGVPFGMQIIPPRFNDGLAFGFAAALERIRPWPLVAPGYAPFGL